ncbi:MAG: hypothetical protein C0506_01235 [Anaerolinea sp.]|nr:hypothetical protein [Anaerolinea sp.]
MRTLALTAAVVLGVFLAACSSGSKPKPVTAPPLPAASETAAPALTPSPASGQFPLHSAPGAFVRLSYAPGEAIDAKHGVFFMDTNTGAVEGWRLSDAAILAGGDSPADCCYIANVSDDNRFIVMRAAKTAWLFDRNSSRAVSWSLADLAFVAAAPHYLLFARAPFPGSDTNPEYDGRYTIIDENFNPVSAFKLEAGGRGLPPVLFSPDERTLIIPAGNLSWSDYKNLQQVDVATGAVRQLADLPFAPLGTSKGPPHFEHLREGSEFAVIVPYPPQFDTARAAVGDLPFRSLVRRYDWGGTLLAEFEVPSNGVSLSPDGKLLAYEHSERYVIGESEGPTERWSNVVIADGRTGSPLFRVRSASLYYGDGLGIGRWLADSTAIPLAVRPRHPRPPEVNRWFHSSFSLLVADAGRLQTLDVPDNDLLGPVPSPDRPGLFALGHASVAEPGTGRRVSANVAEVWFGHMPPWGINSTEIRFTLPHGGHGGGDRGKFLSPRIEYPPFENRLAFHVSGTGSCLNLRALPSLSAEITDCFPDGSRVALADPTPGPPHGTLAAWFADETLWIHVRAADGHEGWVSSDYLQW